ncbi:MAG: polysaccharide deacetylase family protein [Candidatus Omnitrophica bacterium]|nr:polysaccharide deacetylase family protein [Candidatus Omnitrophota bacterium]
MRKKIVRISIFLFLAIFIFASVMVFFDQSVLNRKGTFYHADVSEKVVALTFDDGPSTEWTPKILDELKEDNVKATFFMLGEHVSKYPEIAKRVADEGHEIGNHTYDHRLVNFSSSGLLKKEILDTEKAIKSATGRSTKLFRPPKAWLNKRTKEEIRSLGFEIVLWTINSKDWVTFDYKYIIKYILNHVRPGDIILFHDSGAVFGKEGGSRYETVRTIKRLIEELKRLGYRFVTVTELIEMEKKND